MSEAELDAKQSSEMPQETVPNIPASIHNETNSDTSSNLILETDTAALKKEDTSSNCSACFQLLPEVEVIKLKNCQHFICFHCALGAMQGPRDRIECTFLENDETCGTELNEMDITDILTVIETKSQTNRKLGQLAKDAASHEIEIPSIYFNYETFCCVLCAQQCEPGNGIILQVCCHSVCVACITEVIKRNQDAEIRCPFSRTLEQCDGVLLHCEIRNLVSATEFSDFVDLGLKKQITTVDELLQLDEIDAVETQENFECPICLTEFTGSGDGIILRNCFHSFCKACLTHTVENSEATEILCPFVDEELKQCTEVIEQREIRSVLSVMSFVKYLQRDLSNAELRMQNTFHCLTPNCHGFFIVETGDKKLACSVCGQVNCVECKAIHMRATCAEYKDNTQGYTRQTMEYISKSLDQKEMMRCPKCQNYVIKNGGCNHMTCRCGSEFQWQGMK